MKKVGKFCPRCGSHLNATDAFCIKCGYNFGKKKSKKMSLKSIIILIIVLVAIGIGIRIFLKQPIIPQEFIDLFKNMTSNKTG